MHKSRCSIQINQNVNLTFTFKPVAQPVPTMPLRPYHTLILLSDVKRLLMGGGNLPAASSLMRLLDALQPTKSFQVRIMRVSASSLSAQRNPPCR